VLDHVGAQVVADQVVSQSAVDMSRCIPSGVDCRPILAGGWEPYLKTSAAGVFGQAELLRIEVSLPGLAGRAPGGSWRPDDLLGLDSAGASRIR
jgi:hypothetical protein